jgi:hypothetical protein
MPTSMVATILLTHPHRGWARARLCARWARITSASGIVAAAGPSNSARRLWRGTGRASTGITLTELVEKMLWLRQLIKERGGRASPFRVEAAHEVGRVRARAGVRVCICGCARAFAGVRVRACVRAFAGVRVVVRALGICSGRCA